MAADKNQNRKKRIFGPPLVFMMLPAIIAYNFITQTSDVFRPIDGMEGMAEIFTNKTNTSESSESNNQEGANNVRPVNCSHIDPIEPINIGQMTSPQDTQYFVSFSWWDNRLKGENFKSARPVRGNPSVHIIQDLILKTPGAYVDIGANVGFMTNFAYNLHRQVFAVDPISYNIAKLCEGVAANVEKGLTKNSSFFLLYHGAAGPSFQPNVTIVRPADTAGFFDQSSLSRSAVQKQEVTEEHIPMITVDSIIPEDVAVGVVKIDVQGHEYGVLKGMEGLLGRPKGYHPVHVLYEDDYDMTQKAGYKPSACIELLQSFGYNCTTSGSDKLCSKT